MRVLPYRINLDIRNQAILSLIYDVPYNRNDLHGFSLLEPGKVNTIPKCLLYPYFLSRFGSQIEIPTPKMVAAQKRWGRILGWGSVAQTGAV